MRRADRGLDIPDFALDKHTSRGRQMDVVWYHSPSNDRASSLCACVTYSEIQARVTVPTGNVAVSNPSSVLST